MLKNKKISYKLIDSATNEVVAQVPNIHALSFLKQYGDDILTQLKTSGTQLIIEEEKIDSDINSNVKLSALYDMFKGDITSETVRKFKKRFLSLNEKQQKQAIENIKKELENGKYRETWYIKDMLNIAESLYNLNKNKKRREEENKLQTIETKPIKETEQIKNINNMEKIDKIKAIKNDISRLLRKSTFDNMGEGQQRTIVDAFNDVNKDLEAEGMTTHNQPTPNQAMANRKKKSLMFPLLMFPLNNWYKVDSFKEMQELCMGTIWSLKEERFYNAYSPIWVLTTNDNKYAYSKKESSSPLDKDGKPSPEILEIFPLPKGATAKRIMSHKLSDFSRKNINNAFDKINSLIAEYDETDDYEKLNHAKAVAMTLARIFEKESDECRKSKSEYKQSMKKKSGWADSDFSTSDFESYNPDEFSNQSPYFSVGDVVQYNGKQANILSYDEDGEYTIQFEVPPFDDTVVNEQELLAQNPQY